MRILLIALVGVLAISDAFGLNLSLGPGLSVKNAMLYFVALVLVLRTIIGGGLKFELGGIQFLFAVLIAYAILSWMVTGLIVKYPGYNLIRSAILLKSGLIDYAIFLLVFFYAIRTKAEAILMTQALAAVLVFTSVMTVVSVFGGIDIGVSMRDTENKYGDRILGAFGNPNETGAVIACLLPAVLAAAYTTRGARRIGWLVGAILAFAVLVLTASRAAFVGMIIGGVWALMLCRKYLSMGRVARWAIVSLTLMAPVLALVSLEFGDLLKERFVEQSRATDIWDVSSGRTEIWSTAIARMMSVPLTLITGFGWNAYDSMAFRLAPHNHYLLLWFELGIVGITCFVLILRRAVTAALAAMETTDDQLRGYLIGFVFGFLALSVAIFFGSVYGSWLYVWVYTGVSLRIACLARTSAEETASLRTDVVGVRATANRTAHVRHAQPR